MTSQRVLPEYTRHSDMTSSEDLFTGSTGAEVQAERVLEEDSEFDQKCMDLARTLVENMDPDWYKQVQELAGILSFAEDSGTQTQRTLTRPEQDLLRTQLGTPRLGVTVLQLNICARQRCMFIFVSYGDGLVSFLG